MLSAALAGYVWYERLMPEKTIVNGDGSRDVAPATVAGDEEELFYRDIDGVGRVEKTKERPYYAVMIDNLALARPQHGLSSASVVYEAPVESGITRFMAVFPASLALEKIGPVRSARPYFIDFAAEYDAIYAHVGGSPQALERLKGTYEVFDLNQFWNGGVFWRSRDREAPHNVYTSSEDLDAFAVSKGYESRELDPWLFKDDMNEDERPYFGGDLSVDAKYKEYVADWSYDTKTNDYARRQGSGDHVDALSDDQIRAKNVLVQFTDIEVIDGVGRRKVRTSGEGEAIIALDGQVYNGTWSKGSSGRTRFYDKNGDEILLNRGTTWVTIVATGTEVSY